MFEVVESSHDEVVLVQAIYFFFNDTATTEIYTLSLHDALPISCYYKDTNFQANHNFFPNKSPERTVVLAITKILIFKQITTDSVIFNNRKELYLLLQLN